MTPMQSEQIADLAAALAKTQAQQGPAIINQVNPHFRNRYADLAAVFNALKPAHENGLSVIHQTFVRDGIVMLRGTLLHSSAQWMATEWVLGPVGMKQQEAGSALTYGRRYTTSCLTGLAPDEDDDGEATRKANGNGRHIEATGEVLSEEQRQTVIAAIEARGMKPDAWLKGARAYFQIDAKTMHDVPAVLYTACLAKIHEQGTEKPTGAPDFVLRREPAK